eukprot:COSAG02_NODE_29211_length_574_cov_0.610526_1_plen_179_part_10
MKLGMSAAMVAPLNTTLGTLDESAGTVSGEFLDPSEGLKDRRTEHRREFIAHGQTYIEMEKAVLQRTGLRVKGGAKPAPSLTDEHLLRELRLELLHCTRVRRSLLAFAQTPRNWQIAGAAEKLNSVQELKHSVAALESELWGVEVEEESFWVGTRRKAQNAKITLNGEHITWVTMSSAG